jgi:hypothetical protein
MPELDTHLKEVLDAVTERTETAEEIRQRFENNKTPVVKAEVSWIHRTMLPNSSFQRRPSRQFEEALRELVRQGLIRRSITRFLDEPLERDTEVFARVPSAKI